MSAIPPTPPPVEPQPAAGYAAPYSPGQAPAVAYGAAPPPPLPGRYLGLRYGIGVTAAALGGYALLSGSALNQLSMAFLPGRNDPAFVLLVLGVVVFWTLVTAAAMVVVPGNTVAGWGAATLVLVGVIVYSTIQAVRFTGAAPVFTGAFWVIVLHPATFALLVVGAAWLIARGRGPLGYLLLLAAFLPGAIAYGLVVAGVEGSISQLVTTPVAAIIGVGTAWLAGLMSRGRDPLRSRLA